MNSDLVPRSAVRGSVLVVDDDPDISDILQDRLESLALRVSKAATARKAFELLSKDYPDVMLLDIEIPDQNGMEVLRQIRRQEINTAVVMITAYATVDRAVEAMKEGAYDFITKPFNADQIALTVEKALERQRLKREVAYLAKELGERYRLVAGNSTAMQQAMEMAKKAADSRATVLLLGESGTGKELFARAIHQWSDRANNPFTAINCVGLSKELMESELFGHEKGAFTGAIQLKKGKIELTDDGSIFFDEIGDISLELQTKLLRFLQEREFVRVGGTQTIEVDVRIIAATNRDLERAVQEGCFREDLFHRLNVVAISLPPLRERKEDLPSLARFFLERYSKEAKKRFTKIAPDAEKAMVGYHWPGNVRELANVIERAVVLGEGPMLTLRDLPEKLSAATPGGNKKGSLSYHETINDAKKELVRRVLAETNGNQAAAAKLMGLQRTYLARLIKTLGLR